jgi:hypothetical protein
MEKEKRSYKEANTTQRSESGSWRKCRKDPNNWVIERADLWKLGTDLPAGTFLLMGKYVLQAKNVLELFANTTKNKGKMMIRYV